MKKNPTDIFKKCKKCGEEKSLDLFYDKKSNKDGKESKCKTCKSERYKMLNADPERKAIRNFSAKEWYKNNKESHSSKAAERYIKNKARWNALSEEEKAIRRKKRQQRKMANPNYRAIKACRRRLARYIKNKNHNTVELLGCSPLQLREHLESLWKVGMSWDNYGFEGWHIDHKLPISSFDLSCPEQTKECFHYTNLQPLWAKENWTKGSKIM
jgi:hypothetical protein